MGKREGGVISELDEIDARVGRAVRVFAKAKRRLLMLGVDEEAQSIIGGAPLTEQEWRQSIMDGEVTVNDYRRWLAAEQIVARLGQVGVSLP